MLVVLARRCSGMHRRPGLRRNGTGRCRLWTRRWCLLRGGLVVFHHWSRARRRSLLPDPRGCLLVRWRRLDGRRRVLRWTRWLDDRGVLRRALHGTRGGCACALRRKLRRPGVRIDGRRTVLQIRRRCPTRRDARRGVRRALVGSDMRRGVVRCDMWCRPGRRIRPQRRPGFRSTSGCSRSLDRVSEAGRRALAQGAVEIRRVRLRRRRGARRRQHACLIHGGFTPRFAPGFTRAGARDPTPTG